MTQSMRLAYTVKHDLEIEPCSWCGRILGLGDEAFDECGQGPYCSDMCCENDLKAAERAKEAARRVAFMLRQRAR
jgi:hypothetical protein